MGNGYTVPPKDEIDALYRLIQDILDRIRELERPTGTQTASALKTLTDLVNGLLEQTAVNVTGNITSTGGEIRATVGKLFAGNWYGNNITGSGGYRAAYVSITGEAGYVPSSIAYKQDVAPARVDPEAVLGVEVVRFRYKDAVENWGDAAPVEIGVIAEQVAKLGLPWLLDVDSDGEPVGFKYERLALAMLPALQSLAKRVSDLEN